MFFLCLNKKNKLKNNIKLNIIYNSYYVIYDFHICYFLEGGSKSLKLLLLQIQTLSTEVSLYSTCV